DRHRRGGGASGRRPDPLRWARLSPRRRPRDRADRGRGVRAGLRDPGGTRCRAGRAGRDAEQVATRGERGPGRVPCLRPGAGRGGVRGDPRRADDLGGPARSLPRLTINLFSGGKHAGGQVCIQDVLVVPTAPTIDGGLATAFAVYQAAAVLTRRKYAARALT